jgi:hypothetical protein
MHGGLTLGLDSIGLRLAVIPAVIDAWFAAHFHSIELGPAPFPLSTRSIRKSSCLCSLPRWRSDLAGSYGVLVRGMAGASVSRTEREWSSECEGRDD